MRQTKRTLSKVFNKSFFVYATFIAFILIQIYFFIPSIKNNDWAGKDSTVNTNFNALKNQSEKKTIEQNMKGVHLLENDQKKKGWELFAEEASGSKEEQWLLKKVKARFYTDEVESFTVTGDVGEVDGQTKNMIIRGHVITESSNGYSFATSELKYKAREKKLYSADYVDMKGPDDKDGKGLTLTGQGLEIYIAESKIKILNQVEARKTVGQKKFKVNSDSSIFSNKDREALFSGNVKLQYDSMKLNSHYADFKYSKAKSMLEIVRAYEQVELFDVNKAGTCSELIVNLINDTMTLNGSPKVKINEDEIQGDQIVFSEKGKKVRIGKMKLERKSQ